MMDRSVFPYDPILCPRPDLPKINGRLQYQLLNNFIQVVGDDMIIVPAGYLTDGASIPRFGMVLVGGPLSDTHIYAAIVHDWCYEVHGHPETLADNTGVAIIDELAMDILPQDWRDEFPNFVDREKRNAKKRKDIDKNFYRGMISAGKDPGEADEMYKAVRIGGYSSFHNKKQHLELLEIDYGRP